MHTMQVHHSVHHRALPGRGFGQWPCAPVSSHNVQGQHYRHGQGVAQPQLCRVLAPEASSVAAPSSSPQHGRLQPADLISQVARPVNADMVQMNRNLRSIVGERHPMLMAAADQIFGAGGKKLRPMIVFLVARATADLAGME
eukprot:GHRQ01005999.1.p1 GENE.GHRQ01005999.1~~GHRQ01005999.1.p1  ORF type:complete len:142 (+),score=11.99 GHRQ01005999.1:226-651(+)